MNREIKFRVWVEGYKFEPKKTFFDDKRNSGYPLMVEPSCVYSENQIEFRKGLSVIKARKDEMNFELMQYTGLKDKNGVEIYEGDIVRWKDMVFESELHKGFVIMSEGFWGVVELKKHKIPKETLDFLKNTNNENMINHFYDMNLFALVDDELQILGNIFENPELLKEVES